MVDKWEDSPDKLTWTFTLRDGLDSARRRAGDGGRLRRLAQALGRQGHDGPEADVLRGRPVGAGRQDDQDGAEGALRAGAEHAGQAGPNVPFMMPARIAEHRSQHADHRCHRLRPLHLQEGRVEARREGGLRQEPELQAARRARLGGLAGGKVAKVDRVEWVWIPDTQTQVNALLTDEVDMIEIVPPDLLPLVEKEKGVKIHGRKPGRPPVLDALQKRKAAGRHWPARSGEAVRLRAETRRTSSTPGRRQCDGTTRCRRDHCSSGKGIADADYQGLGTTEMAERRPCTSTHSGAKRPPVITASAVGP